MGQEIKKDDIGTIFILTIKDGETTVPIQSASTKEVCFEKPDGSVVTKDAAFLTDGSDGKIIYTSVSGDLDIVGGWRIQAHVVIDTGTFSSSIEPFTVGKNIC